MRFSILVVSIFARLLSAELLYEAIRTENGVSKRVDLKPFPSELSHLSRTPRTSPGRGLGRRASPITFDQNWCGAVVSKPASTFISVFGSWSPTTVSLGANQTASQEPFIYQWVGIDGATCDTGLLQTGTASQILSNGIQYMYAWAFFYPGHAITPLDIPVNVGDFIVGNVTVTSPTSGIITLSNESKGISVTMTMTGAGTLCQQDAEWILEQTDPPANFAPSSFGNEEAFSNSGQQYGVADAGFNEVKQPDGTITCRVSLASNGFDINLTDGTA